MKKINGMTFDAWFKAVDKEVFEITEAFGVDDLADCCFWDMWHDEVTPHDSAREALSRDTIGQMMLQLQDM
jgi:hypothetical protein